MKRVCQATILLLLVATLAGAVRSAPADGPTERVSVSSGGTAGNGESQAPAISGDARYVAFHSAADNLVSEDTNGVLDVFLHDRDTGQTRRVSRRSDGQQGNCDSEAPAISGGGRTVVFHSCAFNLVPNDTNNVQDVFAYDRNTGEVRRVSVHTDGTGANDVSGDPSVSGDSQIVAFWSHADNLIAGDDEGWTDIFLHDQGTRATWRITVNSFGQGGNGDSQYPAVSNDGRYVVYESDASNLTPGDSGIYRDIFLFDLETGVTERVSVSDDEQEAEGESFAAAVSGSGRYVAFVSYAANLVDDDGNSYPDVFVRDRVDGRTMRVNVSNGGDEVEVFETDQEPTFSADGRYVAFKSRASNLAANDTNGVGDVFLYDLQAGTISLASLNSEGIQGNDAGQSPSLSYDGRYLAFSSVATNLVPHDNNGQRDIFVHDTVGPPPMPALTINYPTGAPGSTFTVDGSDYPAGATITVRINNREIAPSAPIQTDEEGNFRFLLSTAGASEGVYAVEASAGETTLSVFFRLDTANPVRPQEGDGPVVSVPAGIALDRFSYLPAVAQEGVWR
ncbi:MAG: hypothetical protein R3248_05290 [Candidatus Promineifilaceae bacterium]|nr:hypothetical protein [Candidatus Promineifilaceae bacterium]